ncbi:MAG TPA: ferritin family protein [Firmicutes bacterium]|jgi:rubrerythrin|nr:ferritin family protein [Bacillota bacterium]
MHPLEYAMQIEVQGKEFYLKQASLMEDSGFREIFEGLAADEEKHYELLKQMKDSGLYDYEGSQMSDRAPLLFIDSSSKEKIPQEKRPSYITIYQQAVEFEEKSIDLYGELAREATSEREREVFLTLEREEEGHRAVLWRVLEFLQRPEEYYPYL